MEIQDLVGFGMTKTEAVVYLEISKLGETQIGPIIKRTGLHRGTVYNAINDLIAKGFLSFIDKERTRFYKISGQGIFKELIKEKQKETLKEEKQIKEFFNGIEKLKEKMNDQDIQVLNGVEAFKNLFLEIYDYCKKNNSEYFFQGTGGEMQKATGLAFYKYTQELKKKMKVKCRVILNRESKNMSYHKYTVGNIRYLTTKVYSPINFWVYGENLLIVLFGTKPLVNIKIKSKLLADGFRNYFENLWWSLEREQKSTEKRHKINLYEFMLPAKESLDIMGINCLIPVHEGREKMLELLKNNKKIRILLINSKSKNFKERVRIEERFLININESRILYELKSVIANLKDIKTRLLKNNCDLEVRIFDKRPICSMIIIDDKKTLYNKYKTKKGEYGCSQETLILNKEDKEFKKAKDIFEEYWKSAKPLKI